MGDTPNFADIRLITGDQGSGKSCTEVAFAVGDYYDKLTGIVSPTGEVIKAQCIDKKDKLILRQAGLTPNKFNYVRVFSDNGRDSKLIHFPKNFMAVSQIKIFANFHLYGIVFSYITLADLIQYVNTELFNDAWILSDESVMTDARNSMETAGKLVAALGATIRKRDAHLCIGAQYNEMVERRFRLFKTTTVECTYDEDSKYITLEITKRGEQPFTTDYWSPNYWRFYNTKELIPVPQQKIDKVLARMY
jgi:hypothetical protein